MPLHRGYDRNRAALALQQLIGGDATERVLPSIPVALAMPHANLIIATGDNREALSPFSLKPLARAHQVHVLATWADGILSGHAFQIDAVLLEEGNAVQFSAYRLWMMPRRGNWLVPPNCNGDAVSLGTAGIRRATRQPWRSELDLTLGIARGQAWMQRAVYGGTPFETPLEQNFIR